VSGADEYALIVTPPAARSLAEGLPEAVATAVIEFLTTALVVLR
jgi:mRNA interferase RelE/StbE